MQRVVKLLPVATEDVTILHVDDELEFTELVASRLEQNHDHLEVIPVESVEQALAYLGEIDVDCIVSDYQMPDKNGIDFLETVRERDPDLPFVFFTATGSEAVASEALSEGATDYVQKGASREAFSELATRVTRAVEQARERSQRVQLLEAIGTAQEGISMLDEDGQFVYVNEAYADLYGYEPAEMVGMAWESIYPDDQIGFTQEEVLPVLKEHGYWKGESIGKRADGTTFVEDHVIATTAQGGYVCTVRDVSDQRAREQLLTRTATVLQTMLSNLPVGVLVEDTDHTVLLANERLCEMLDLSLTPEELEGEDWETIAEQSKDRFSDSEALVSTRAQRLAERTPVTGEEFILASGQTLERDYIPYEHAEGEANLWLYRDVTEKKLHERQLQREIERLEEFASIVSHDLRNPLNVAQGHLELAREEFESEHLESVANALDRMGSLIESTLKLAKNGQSVDEPEVVDLQELVTQCWQTVETANATLEMEAELTIEADPERLRSLFENLFRNAVEHGGETVTVRVGPLDSGGFYVEDDGPGITAEDRNEVFEAGYSTAADGTGFGLAIVETIAEAHGWRVRATESQTGGARFEFTSVATVE